MFSGASADQVGQWILVCFGFLVGALTIAWLGRQLWVSFNQPPPPAKPSEQEFVTRHELAMAMSELKGALSQAIGRSEYESRHDELEKRIVAMDGYIHQRFHDLNNSLGVLNNNVTAMTMLLNREIGRREGQGQPRSIPPEQP